MFGWQDEVSFYLTQPNTKALKAGPETCNDVAGIGDQSTVEVVDLAGSCELSHLSLILRKMDLFKSVLSNVGNVQSDSPRLSPPFPSLDSNRTFRLNIICRSVSERASAVALSKNIRIVLH